MRRHSARDEAIVNAAEKLVSVMERDRIPLGAAISIVCIAASDLISLMPHEHRVEYAETFCAALMDSFRDG